MRTSPNGLRKGAWTEEEDTLLRKCIEKYGEGRWYQVPHRSGLNRCRKSCRLRWLNYLRPNINRGDFSSDEDDLIIRLHKLLGNRWSLIAGRLPDRTANDIKNYWNSHLQKKLSPTIDGGSSSKNNINNNKSPKITATTIIKPRPRTFSKCAPPWLMNLKKTEISADQTISTRIVNDETIMNPVITDLGPKSDESNMVGSIGNDMQWLDNLLLNDDGEMISEGPIWSFFGGGSTGDELGGIKNHEGTDVDIWDLLFSDL